jgi:hypothetical protein
MWARATAAVETWRSHSRIPHQNPNPLLQLTDLGGNGMRIAAQALGQGILWFGVGGEAGSGGCRPWH